ncbi:MAG: hypothetical protein KAU03_05940 [Candidatus Altiarchaeales archaeon]|nr:hypothetical protein [Candidatus Altiarchaeales archaeon]
MGKRRGAKEIKKDVMKFFEKQTFPRTTGQVAKAVKLNWHSANYYLMLLKDEGKLFHEKVGRQNQWWPENINRLTKKVKAQAREIAELKKRIGELEEK